jgi:hypothetical protein
MFELLNITLFTKKLKYLYLFVKSYNKNKLSFIIMDKKPSVFPNKEQITAANEERARKEAFESEKNAATNQIYTGPTHLADTPEGHSDALFMMQERTRQQLEQKNTQGRVVVPELADPDSAVLSQRAAREKSEEQIRLRDEQLEKNIVQTQNYQRLAEEATNRPKSQYMEPANYYDNPNKVEYNDYIPPTPKKPEYNSQPQAPTEADAYILEISQPNYNSPFDVIPLPSKGKTYRNRKENIRLSYMTTADENILTSPNLLQSGQFLNVLINRKILEPELRYKDLLVGDRNAIMIWLRATGYGEMYPVTILDENGNPFDTEINLNELKTKNLGVEPDGEGLFDYYFKLSDSRVKFRMLTCGDSDEIERIVEEEKKNGVLIDNTSIYTMERTIVEVNGFRDRETIKNFVNSIRIKDGKEFDKYLESIESGIDLNITVGTPGGGSVDTFLPLNFGFFWPDFRV